MPDTWFRSQECPRIWGTETGKVEFTDLEKPVGGHMTQWMAMLCLLEPSVLHMETNSIFLRPELEQPASLLVQVKEVTV